MSLASVLATMTYKPTYSFEIVDVNGSAVLRVTMHTHDSRPDEPVPLSIPVDFPVPNVAEHRPGRFTGDGRVTYTDTEEGFWQDWLRGKIHWCELHESDEWLRFDGVLHRDPHNHSMIR
jgi:hypothetical protein